jgi:hypothetical protein
MTDAAITSQDFDFGTGANPSLNLTVPANCAYAFVFTGDYYGNIPTAMAIGGVAMTVRQNMSKPGCYSVLFALASPTAGAQTLTTTKPSGNALGVRVVYVTGVSPSDPFYTTDITVNGNSNAGTGTIASALSGLVLSFFTCRCAGTISTASTNGTRIGTTTVKSACIPAAAKFAATGGNITCTETYNGTDNWIGAIVSLKPLVIAQALMLG